MQKSLPSMVISLLLKQLLLGMVSSLRWSRNAKVRALADLDTKEIDLKGETAVPGFTDTHPHKPFRNKLNCSIDW